MRRFRLVLVGLVAIGMMAGCALSENKGEAEYFAGSFYETVKVKDFNTVLTFYSPRFFEKVPRAEWLKSLHTINARLGDLQEYRLAGWNLRKWYGTSGSGTYFQFQYRVTYSKYPADEVVTVFKPLLGGEMQIIGHHINSEGFLKS